MFTGKDLTIHSLALMIKVSGSDQFYAISNLVETCEIAASEMEVTSKNEKFALFNSVGFVGIVATNISGTH